MAAFNPSPETQNPPSFLQYSRGIDVNTQGDSTKGKMYSGLGDIIKTASSAANTSLEGFIKADLTEEVDRVRDEQIVGTAATIGRQVAQDAPPPEIQKNLEQAGRLTRAANGGALPWSHYWSRMDAIARQLRSKYAGHRDYIDQQMSSMVGTNPANALVRSLHDEAEANARKAASGGNREESFYEKNLEFLTSAERAKWENRATSKMSYSELRLLVGERQQKAHELRQAKATIDYEAANNRLDKDKLQDTISNAAGTLDSKYFGGTMDSMNATSARFISEVDRATKLGSKLPVEQKESLISLFNQAKQEYFNEFDSVMSERNSNDPSSKSLLQRDHQHVALVRAKAVERWKVWESALKDEKLGILGVTKAMMEATDDANGLRLRSDEFMSRAIALRKALGDQNLTSAFDGKSMVKYKQQGSAFLLGGVLERPGLQGLNDIRERARNLPKSGSEEKRVEYANAVTDDVIRKAVSIINNPEADLADKKATIELLFGPRSRDFLASIKRGDSFQTQSERAAFVRRILDPKLIDSVAKIRDSVPGAWENIRAFSDYNLTTHSLETASNLRHINEDSTQPYKIEYTGNGRFREVLKDPTVPRARFGKVSASLQVRQAVQSLNNHAEVLEAIYRHDQSESLEGKLRNWLLSVANIQLEDISPQKKKPEEK